MDFGKGSEIAALLSKKVAGELTTAEQQALDRWLATSDANRTLYDEIVRGQVVAAYGMEMAAVDTAHGLGRIDRRIRQARRRRIKAWSASVAVIAFAVAIFTLPLDKPVIGDIPVIVSPAIHQALLEIGEDKVVELTGAEDASAWEKYAEDADAGKTTEAHKINTIRITVPRGSEYKIRLGDGSMVWLNSESRIEYPEHFADDCREVRIWGEAFFDVERDGQRPFVVMTSKAEIRVFGTSFNVSAYDDEDAVTTTLVSGSVEVSTPENTVRLTPGKQAKVCAGSPGITVGEVDASLYSAWTRGVFEFDKMTLADICARLSRWYDVQFVFEDGAGNERFTGGTRKDGPLAGFLDKIGRVTDISFRYDRDKVVVTSGR